MPVPQNGVVLALCAEFPFGLLTLELWVSACASRSPDCAAVEVLPPTRASPRDPLESDAATAAPLPENAQVLVLVLICMVKSNGPQNGPFPLLQLAMIAAE